MNTIYNTSLGGGWRYNCNSFNALRFFFCLIVIIGHCFEIAHLHSEHRNLIETHLSVCAFFIISGYWVTKSYLKTRNIRLFWKKRIIRIFPLYLLSVFGFALTLFFFTKLSISDYYLNLSFWKYLFWNTITLNFLAPTLPGVFNGNAVNGALWTIKIEIGFYLILPLIIYILDQALTIKKKNIILFLLYISSIIYYFTLHNFQETLGIPKQLLNQLPTYLCYFICGMIYLYNEEFLRRYNIFLFIPSIFLFILHYFINIDFVMPIILTIIIMFVGHKTTIFSEVGQPVDYSYGMYLFHFPLISCFTHLKFFEIAPIFSILVIIALSLAMAFITEKYIQQKIDKKFLYR